MTPRIMAASIDAASTSPMLSAHSSIPTGLSNRIDDETMGRIDRLLGMIDERVYVVVYTMRGSTIRIISARKGNRKEIANYEHNAHQD